MKISFFTKTVLLSTLLLTPSLYANETIDTSEPLPALNTQSHNSWKHQLTLYGWVAIPDATITYRLPNSNEEATSEIADKIDMVFMGTYRGQLDKYSVILDLIYLGMSSDQEISLFASNPNIPTLNLQAEESLDAWMTAAYAGYNIINDDSIRLDAIGGFRYVSIGLDATIGADVPLVGYRNLELSGSVDLWDAVIGVDGLYTINSEWYIPYHFDIGAGDSDMTWRASAGLGYHFDWGDLLLSYRHIEYDLADSKIIQDIQFAGPLLGVNFNF